VEPARGFHWRGEGEAVRNSRDAAHNRPFGAVSPWRVADMVGFGVFHPCLTFDKWRVLHLVDAGYTVTGSVRTYFRALEFHANAERYMVNELKARLKAGRVCVNGWSILPSPFAAELLAQTGWDSITIDMQHGLHDYASAVSCIQAMQAHPVTPLVRVPWNEPGILGKVLDAGAWGVICPMVNTPADAIALTRACLYPPLGRRSNGPVRAAAYGGVTPYQQIANDEVLILPQIETREAVDNLEAILDVPGVSGVYVGPGDLGFSMGLPPILDREEPEILSIYEAIVRETSKRGLIAGVHNTTPTYAARMAAMGFRLVTVGSDSGFLGRAARDAVTATRKGVGELAER